MESSKETWNISSTLKSELYHFSVTAIFKNILPAGDVMNLFYLHIKQTEKR